MTRYDTLNRTLRGACLGALLAGGCATKTQPAPSTPSTPATPATPPPATTPTTEAKLAACNGKLVPAEDGSVEDFEDGDSQIKQLAGRNGYWWTAHDELGSTFTLPQGQLAPSDGGAESTKAVHVTGKTAAGGSNAWGVEFGTNWVNAKGGLYDASKYAGLSFKAKATGATKSVRVSLGDVNTHADAGVCKTCWNHFRKDFQLTEDWQTHTLSFAELKQRPGWGDPSPPALTADKLVALSFALEGGKDFDVWVDDIVLLSCVP